MGFDLQLPTRAVAPQWTSRRDVPGPVGPDAVDEEGSGWDVPWRTVKSPLIARRAWGSCPSSNSWG